MSHAPVTSEIGTRPREVAIADSGVRAPSSVSRLEPPERILVIQFRRLGDVIMAAGMLEDLRTAFPNARIDFLTSALSAKLLAKHPLIDDLLIYDREHPLREIGRIRRRRYDWVFDGQGSPTTARLAWLSGAHVRAGWGVKVWRYLYTHVVPRKGLEKVYVVRERQRFFELLGVPFGPPRTRLVVTPDERAAAERALIEAGVVPEKRRVALVLSVSEQIREWPAERFAQLALRLTGEGIAPVVLENPDDASRLERFRRIAPNVPVVNTFDLRLLMAAIASCDVLVSGDTGPAHMATALGVPRVTLYGPTDPNQWSPKLPTTAVLVDGQFEILGSKQRRKLADHPGLTGIAVDDVAREVHRLVASSREKARNTQSQPIK